MTFDIIRSQHEVRTRGLSGFGQRELSASVKSGDFVRDAEAFLAFAGEYVISSHTHIHPGETLAYGYWLTKFVEAGDLLEAWEYTPDATEFVPGVTLAVTYWRDQHRTCDRYHGEFTPPRPDRMIVISDGVLEGDSDVQGVRYPSPEDMSGWWLTTNRYDGDVASLKAVHAYHVTASRPDLAHLLALPFGFRFDRSRERGEDAWFDEKVAAEDAV